MQVRFKEIKEAVAATMGLKQFSDATLARQTTIILRINQIQDIIFFDRPYDWRRRTKYFSTRPPYETGTISVTKNSRVVTGSGTTWTEDMKNGIIVIRNKFYKIDSVDSTTSITLFAPYPDDTGSSLTYKVTFPFYPLHPELSAVTDVLNDNKSLTILPKERRSLVSTSVNQPQEISIVDINDQVLYSTGTVSVTNLSATVTGTTTVWTTAMEGHIFRVNEFSEDYVIKKVVSATSLILEKPYRGVTSASETYQIDPEGAFLMRVQDPPDDVYFMEVEGLIRAKKLINDDDISLIPDHSALIAGAMYLAYADLEDRNPFLVQQKRADFEKQMKQLRDTYQAVTNVRWTSELEVVSRKTGLERFDPLSDNCND